MAGEEDGSQFIGIDERAIGGDSATDDPGEVDATTRPLSMGLENRIDGNIRYLQERGSQCTKAWYTSWRTELDTRPYVSLEYSYIALIPFELQAGMDELRCKLQCNIGINDSNTTASVDLALELRDNTGRLAFSEQTEGPTTGVEVKTLTLDLSSTTVERGRGAIGVLMRSAARSSGTQVSVNTGIQFGGVESLGIEYADDTTDGTADAEISETASLGQGAVTEPTIPIHKSSVTADSTHITGLKHAIQDSYEAHEESFVEPISAAFEVRYVSGEDAGFYQDKSARSMQAQTPALGRQVSQHGQNLDHLYQRPKCRAIGPKGQNKGEGWPTDYRRQWTWANLTDTNTGDDARELDRQAFHFRHHDSTVRCIAYLAGFFGTTSGNTSTERVWEAFFSDDEYRAKSRAVGDIDVEIEVQQMPGGGASVSSWADATTVASSTQTIDDFSYFHVCPFDFYPLAQQVFWSRRPESADGATATEYHFPYHDGQVDPDDLDFVSPVTFDLDVDPTSGADDAGRGEPMRVNLNLDTFTSPNTNDVTRGDGDFTYHVLCLGTSWWELPNL